MSHNACLSSPNTNPETAMTAGRMHDDEIDIDDALVSRLVAAQFPQWADLRLERVDSSGTDNAIYRLGHDMAVRLPRRPGATAQVEKEQQWLPRLAPLLPLAIPVPLGNGIPSDNYPWPWLSMAGSKAKTRPSSASPIQPKQRPTSRSSSRPCSASIRPTARRQARTTLAVAYHSHYETHSPARQSKISEASSISTR